VLLVLWIGIGRSKFYQWRDRYGKVNEHNGWIPRDHWVTPEERRAVIEYHDTHADNGYRRLTYMMMDDDVVALSPSTVYRILKKEGKLWQPPVVSSRRGKGFAQPNHAHRDWHIDFSHVRVSSVFYHLCSIIDGYSRYIVAWGLMERMRDVDAQIVLQKAREVFPDANPNIISDNGSHFVSREFKSFLTQCEFRHIRTSPYYPQSNGKKERWFGSLKRECLRPGVPLTFEDAERLIGRYVEEYNHARLHSSIGYVAPADRLHGLDGVIHRQRDEKLEAARERRRLARQAMRAPSETSPPAPTPVIGEANRIDFAALRQRTAMRDVLHTLGILQQCRGFGPQKRGPFPIHQQQDDGRRHRSFSVNLDRGLFRCFHPDCQVQGNVLDLWAACHNLSLPDAARSLAERFAPDLIPLAN